MPTNSNTRSAEKEEEEIHLTNTIVLANPNPKQENLRDEVETTQPHIGHTTVPKSVHKLHTGGITREATITTSLHECD